MLVLAFCLPINLIKRKIFMIFKRILLVSHEMTYTGAPRSLLNVARILRAHGNYVKVATLIPGDFEKEFSAHGFWVRHFNAERYEYELLAKKQDLVIANTVFCGRFAYNAQKYVPTVLYIREAANLPDIMKTIDMDDEYITKAKNIVCVSEYAEECIRSRFKVDNIKVLHNFLKKPLFYKPAPNLSRDGKVHFLIAGTVEKRKGYDVALKAFDMLDEEAARKAVLHIAGRRVDWAADYFESLRLNERSNVIYHGEISDSNEMMRLYKSVNAVMVPSFDESCSLTALEGAMHGKALIVSENVGAKYMTKGSGFIFETGSAEKLAEAINKMVLNTDGTEAMGRAAYNNYLEYATAERYYTGFDKIYRSLGR